MKKFEDWILDVLADIIVRFLISAFVVLIFLRYSWRAIFVTHDLSWGEVLIASGLIGFLISLTAIRKGPGAI